MRIAFAALAVLLVAGPAAASDATDIMATVKTFDDAMRKGDMKAAGATYAASATIIDDVAPFHWSGASAFADWGAAFGADAKVHAITDPLMKFGPARHLTVVDNDAYLSVPGTFTFKRHGKPTRQTGSFSFVMQKTEGTWQIAGWGWARR